VDLPAAFDADHARGDVGGEPFFEDRGGSARFDRVGSAPAVSGSGDAVGESVVGADAVDDLEEGPAARKIDAFALDHGPFVNGADALRRELSAEPVVVVCQDDAFHP